MLSSSGGEALSRAQRRPSAHGIPLWRSRKRLVCVMWHFQRRVDSVSCVTLLCHYPYYPIALCAQHTHTHTHLNNPIRFADQHNKRSAIMNNETGYAARPKHTIYRVKCPFAVSSNLYIAAIFIKSTPVGLHNNIDSAHTCAPHIYLLYLRIIHIAKSQTAHHKLHIVSACSRSHSACSIENQSTAAERHRL